MANRSTRFILKNNANSAAPFSGATLFAGEPIVNTAAGIMMFSGVTSGTNDWVPAGDGANGNFFEVGSNLYNLKIRNQITSYSGVTALDGLFLSGTSNGFVLAPISSITGVDTYVTNFSYDDANKLTLVQNEAGQTFNVFINTMTGLTVSGVLSATTANIDTENVTTLNATGGTITTLNSTTVNGDNVNVNNLTITGSATYNQTASAPNDIVNYSTLTAFSQTTDVYVTGNTLTPATDFTNTQQALLEYHGTPIGGPYVIDTLDTFTTGGTYNNSTKQITFKKNSGSGDYIVDLSSIDVNDTYVTGGTITTAPSNDNINGVIGLKYNQDVPDGTYSLPFTDIFTTGFTYNSTNNTFTLKDNNGNTFNQSFNTVSGLTFSNLTAGRVVYVGTGGLLTDEAGFTYDAGTNTLSVPSDGAVSVGTGGLSVAGDAVIQGSLTVFGPSVSAFTSELYVEDPNITLNYNPTGNTTATSIGAGWTLQDGNGINGGDVNLNINRLDTLTGLTASNVPSVVEYTSSTGFANRGWITQLNDIVIRSTNVSTPNGVRLLAEFDVLDGGTY